MPLQRPSDGISVHSPNKARSKGALLKMYFIILDDGPGIPQLLPDPFSFLFFLFFLFLPGASEKTVIPAAVCLLADFSLLSLGFGKDWRTPRCQLPGIDYFQGPQALQDLYFRLASFDLLKRQLPKLGTEGNTESSI